MKLYAIRNWAGLFENSRSRQITELTWVPIPNRHDGENYSMIVAAPDGAQIFAAWVLMLQVASRCNPRGTLVRDNGNPHTPDTLALKTRAPAKWFTVAIAFLEKHTDWLETKEMSGGCQAGVTQVPAGCQPPVTEGNGTEGTEQKELNRTENARLVLKSLNESSGRAYRETETNMGFIAARLDEPGVDLQGVLTMVSRQCRLWKGTDMENYLRPETLFNKTKFDSYYAAKDLPIPGKTAEAAQLQETINVPIL